MTNPAAINVDFKQAEGSFQALLALVKNKAALDKRIGRSVTQFVRAHLFARDKTHPNQLGGRRTHFWAQAARGTQYTVDSQGVIIAIHMLGIRLQYYGGTILPGRNKSFATGKPTKWLTIPAIAEAHGRRAKEFHGLKLLMRLEGGKLVPYGLGLTSKGATVGGTGEPGTGKKLKINRKKLQGLLKTKYGIAEAAKEAKHWRVIFWLVKEAHVKPHPDVLPSSDAILAIAKQAVLDSVGPKAKAGE